MSSGTLVASKPCWMRVINIIFYNNKGNTIKYGGTAIDQLSIKITGTKELNASKDNCTIAISNLTYEDIIRITEGEFYGAIIEAGYRTSGVYNWFNGEIAYVSQKISARRDYTAYIICTSHLIANALHSRLQVSLNSGINLYTAYKILNQKAGISGDINESYRKSFLTKSVSAFASVTKLTDIINDASNTSSSDDDIVDQGVDTSNLSDKRQIKISDDTISFKSGNPTLDSSGLSIHLYPTFDFQTGDIIIIDNAIIDISETSYSSAKSSFKGNYLDTTLSKTNTPTLGMYMIRKIDYSFANRSDEFDVSILARAISLTYTESE